MLRSCIYFSHWTKAFRPCSLQRPIQGILMRFSIILAAAVAAIVGFGGTAAILLQAAQAVGATPAESASWLASVSLAIIATSLFLSVRYRVPAITAWSTPAAALIATTTGFALPEALGAFIFTGLLLILTAAFRPLIGLVARIPASIASAMLAGVLISFVIKGFAAASVAPMLVVPLIVLFVLARLFSPFGAVIFVILGGFILAQLLGMTSPLPPFELTKPVWVTPHFDWQAMISLGLPLYFVTMASQNLPGFAVLRSHGYEPPVPGALFSTGLASMVVAPFCGHTLNLSAIVASVVMSKDVHPDPAQRWQAGVWYSIWYVPLTIFAGSFIALFAAMPPAFMAIVAGLGIVGALTGALTQAVAQEKERFAAIFTFGIAASGLSFYGVGAAFWALLGGLTIILLDKAVARFG
jgi:benzoate membrane transport protein